MTTDLAAALGPVRGALIARARAEAAAAQSAAAAAVARVSADAEQVAAELLAAARAEGTADAEAALAYERAAMRRRARSTVLRARRLAVERLGEQARIAVLALATAPELAQLPSVARARLGAAATVTADPDGGVVAVADDRRIDYRLTGFADRAVAALGGELEEAWLR